MGWLVGWLVAIGEGGGGGGGRRRRKKKRVRFLVLEVERGGSQPSSERAAAAALLFLRRRRKIERDLYLHHDVGVARRAAEPLDGHLGGLLVADLDLFVGGMRVG